MSAGLNGQAKPRAKTKNGQPTAAIKRNLTQEDRNAPPVPPPEVLDNRLHGLDGVNEGFSYSENENSGEAEAFEPLKEAQNGFSSPAPEIRQADEKPGGEPSSEADEEGTAKNRGGRPPVLDEYARGIVVMALAIGLTQREAAAFVGCDQSTISNLLHGDERVARDLEFYKCYARFHPFLKIYNESTNNWKASVWLLEFLEQRNGALKVEDLMSMLLDAWDGTRARAQSAA